jgi:hypothetical protein
LKITRYFSQLGVTVKMHLLDHNALYIERAILAAETLNIKQFVTFYVGDAMLLTEEWIQRMHFNIISTTAAVGSCFNLKQLVLASSSEDIKLFLFSEDLKADYKDLNVKVELFAECWLAAIQ